MQLPDQNRDASMGSDKPGFYSENNGKPLKDIKPDRSHIQIYVLKQNILANVWRIACGRWAKDTFGSRDRMKIDGLDRISEKKRGCLKILH